MRRRLMLRNASGSADIPIGVNLITETYTGFWLNTTVGSTNYSYYNEGSYVRFIVPFDTNCTFTMRNIVNIGNTRSYLVDQNGVVRWVGTETDPTNLKTIAQQIENNSIKITNLYANSRIDRTPVWERTS